MVVIDTFASEDFDHNWDQDDHIVPVYTIDAPINVVGGPDCNRLVIVGSEFGQTPEFPFYGWYDGHHHAIEVDDNFAVGDSSVLGGGLNITYQDLAPQQFVEHNPCDYCVTGLFFLGVDGQHGDGIGHDDTPLPVVAESIDGISAAFNQEVLTADGGSWGHPNVQDDDNGPGISLTVATQTAGQVIVRESGGSTLVYEQGQTVDSFTVALVSAPAAAVYVNVSAAASPSEAAAGGARTVLVSIDNGATWQFAAVLTFAAGDMGPKTVLVRAIDDAAAEGPLNAVLSLSSQSADPVYNHAEIRDVYAEVIDNDQAGLVIVESDGNTTVLQGAPPYGIVDTYTIAPTMAPALYTNVKVTLFYDDDNLIVTSTDPRFDPTTRTFTFDWTNWTTPAVVTVAAGTDDPHWGGNLDDQLAEGSIFHVVTSTDPNYIAQFGTGLVMHSNGDDQWGHMQWSDGNGWLDDNGWEDQGWSEQNGWYDWFGYWDGDHGWHAFPHQVPVVNVNILRPDEDVVYLVQSDGSTLVAQGDPNGDTYTIRLTAAPLDGDNDKTLIVELQSDGQTIASDACSCDPRFTPGTAGSYPTVTFDLTNWWIPFTVRLTSNPAAPATDPFQPLQAFPTTPDERTYETDANPDDFRLVGGIRFGEGWFDGRDGNGGPVWVDGYGWFNGQNWFDGDGFFNGHGGWFFDGDNWFDGQNWLTSNGEPSLHNLLCNDGSPSHWYSGQWGGGWGGDWGWQSSFGCEDLPARQPVILPNEQGAGPPPDIKFIPCNLTVEATSPAGATVSYDPAKIRGEVGPATLSYTQASGTTFPIGTTTIGIYAIDLGGNYTNASFTITVRDTTAPTFTSVTPNITVEATAPGTPVFFAPATATDAVGPVTITYTTQSGTSVLPGSLFPIGTTTVTETATDAYGNHSSKTFKVTVQDTTAPVVSAVNITVEATQSTGYKVSSGSFTSAVTWSDASGSVTLTYSKSVGTVLPFGTTSVTVTATDASGNHSSATFTVTVQDHTPPTITAPDITVEATSSAGAKVTYFPTATDATGTPTVSVSIASGTTFGIGTTPVTVTATDTHGNTATKTFNVTVRDTTPPSLTVPLNVSVEATGPMTAVTYGTATASDSVSGVASISYSALSGSLFPVGATTVFVTATDGRGNSVTKSFTVTVKDTTAPVITTVPANVTMEATGPLTPVTFAPLATATDAVTASPTITYSVASGSGFSVGTTTVTVTATDAAGNHSSKTFTVTIKDTTPPVVSAVNIPLEANQAAGYNQSAGYKIAAGSFTSAVTASDLVGPVTLTYSKSVGTILPFGTTSVTVTATDASGNHSSATFVVTVQDTTAPVIAPLPNLTLEATSSAGAKATYAPTATDATGPPTVTVTIASGTTFAIGTTPVTVTATDGHGNSSSLTFTVTVKDSTPPSLTVPANVTIEATGPMTPVTWAAATASDPVSGVSSIVSTLPSGSLFPVGSTTVSVTATDGRGNSVTKSFTVTVKDTTAPVITTTYASILLEATGVGTPVSFATAVATDAVGVVSYSYSMAPGSLFPIGSTLVTVTAYDAAGNHSSKSFTVTIKDTTAPVVSATNITVEATQSTGFKIASGSFASNVTWSDASGSVTLSYSKSVGTVLPFGTTSVTVTATDASGNHSSATFTVTVQDHTAPVIAPLPNLTLEATSSAGAKGTYSPTATDAVGPVTIVTSIPSGTIFPFGTTTVTVTATDGHGNSSSTSFTVTVQDTTPPQINAPLYLVVEATSLAGAVVNYPSFATDIDGPIVYTYSIPSGTLFPLSFTGPVTMTATDAYGNTSTGSFTVFVHDSTPPVFTSISGNLTIEATSAAGAVVNYAPATATDALAPPIFKYSQNAGTTFAIGTTTVWVTAIDIVGNTTTKFFTITVRDTTPPAIVSVSPNLTVEATSPAGATVNYAAAVATDAVGPVTISYSKSSGSKFAIGTTTVTVTAKDAYGNTSTASFTREGPGHDAAGDRAADEPRARGHRPVRREGHLQPDGDGRGRPGHDHDLDCLGHDVRDRDDDRDRDGKGLLREHLDRDVHGHGAGHDAARVHLGEREPDHRGDRPAPAPR